MEINKSLQAQTAFDIPHDRRIMVQLIKAVPSSWNRMSGKLYATEDLVELLKAERNTGCRIEWLHDKKVTRSTIISSYHPGEEREIPNFPLIVLGKILPGFIFFNHAGIGKDVPLDHIKKIVVNLVAMGYCGKLHFTRGMHNDRDGYKNPCDCEVVFELWFGVPVLQKKIRIQSAYVELAWDNWYAGNDASKAPCSDIIAACRSLGLREYTPVDSVAVA